MNLTSKQRANLRSIASQIEPCYIIGKGNVTDNIIKGIDEALAKRELIKITVLKSADLKAREMVDEIAQALDATVVCTIGNKIVLYRYSDKEGITHVIF